jgi:hypothetical protein
VSLSPGPWLVFLLFSTANALLAYGRFPVPVSLGLGAAGLLLPLSFLLRVSPGLSPKRDGPWNPSPSAFLLVALAGALLRFCGSVRLSVWPMWDDANYGYYAATLAEKWRWRLFFGPENYMPLYVWLQALYDKLAGISLPTMWAYPALYSFLALPLAYAAARRFASRSFSFLYLVLLSTAFWPVLVSKFSTDIGLGLLWEYGAFLLLGVFHSSLKDPRGRPEVMAGALGFLAGLGWYASKFWVFSLPVFGLLVPALCAKERRGFRPAFCFFAGTLLPLLPMAFLIGTGRYGSYLWPRFLQLGPAWRRLQGLDTLSYWTSFFWGCVNKTYYNFDALWGGLFNPLLGGAFFVGAVGLYRGVEKRFFWLGSLALFLYILPASLTLPIEINRVVPAMPLFLFVVTAGWMQLSCAWKGRGKAAAALFLLISLGLDLYQLEGPYHDWAVPGPHSLVSKSPERYRAFGFLEERARRDGPGLVLDDLIPDAFDQSLLVACYPFNAAVNPKLSPDRASWAGILVPEADAPGLSRRFPEASYVPLSGGLDRYDRALGLLILPLTPQNRPTLSQWTRADRDFLSSYGDIPYHLAEPSYRQVMDDLRERRADFESDPFLACCYWAKMADYASYGMQEDPGTFLQASARALQCGRPSGDLDLAMAHWCFLRRDFAGTRRYLDLAVASNPSIQVPPSFQERLDSVLKRQDPGAKERKSP